MTGSQTKVDFSKIDEIITQCGGKKSNLIAILQKVQEVYRYLPEDAMIYIGTKIEGLSPATVFGVATFYAQFSLDPKGKYEVKCCDGKSDNKCCCDNLFNLFSHNEHLHIFFIICCLLKSLFFSL